MSVRSHTYVYKAKSRSRSYCFSGVHAGPTYRTSALRRLGEAYPLLCMVVITALPEPPLHGAEVTARNRMECHHYLCMGDATSSYWQPPAPAISRRSLLRT